MKKAHLILTLFFLSLFPPFSFFSDQYRINSFEQALLICLLSLFITLIFFLTFLTTLKNWGRSALATLLILFVFHSWSSLSHLLEGHDIFLGPFRLGPNSILALFAGILLACALNRLKQLQLLLSPIKQYAPILTFLLLIAPLTTIILHLPRNHAQGKNLAGKERPDIYFIIPDAYAGKDILLSHFDINNAPFLDSLAKRNFFVVQKSRANYPNTALSITTLFTMEYQPSPAIGKALERLRQNHFFRLLREHGYTVTAFDASGWEVMREQDVENYQATPFIGPYAEISEFLQRTVLGYIPYVFYNKNLLQIKLHRKKMRHALHEIATSPKKYGPHFIFGHILIPHMPFVFDSTGRDFDNFGKGFALYGLYLKPEERPLYRQGYHGQLLYANKLLLPILDSLLARKLQPVILLMSDHGSGMYRNPATQAYLSPRERLSNLAAVYFPDKDYTGWDDTLSPVNISRLIANKYLDGHFARLPDQSFLPDTAHPDRFLEYTDSVR